MDSTISCESVVVLPSHNLQPIQPTFPKLSSLSWSIEFPTTYSWSGGEDLLLDSEDVELEFSKAFLTPC